MAPITNRPVNELTATDQTLIYRNGFVVGTLNPVTLKIHFFDSPFIFHVNVNKIGATVYNGRGRAIGFLGMGGELLALPDTRKAQSG